MRNSALAFPLDFPIIRLISSAINNFGSICAPSSLKVVPCGFNRDIIAYSSFGGVRSVVFTDVLQFIALAITILAIAILVLA